MATRLKLVLSRRQEGWKHLINKENVEINDQIQKELEQQGYVTKEDRNNECEFIQQIG